MFSRSAKSQKHQGTGTQTTPTSSLIQTLADHRGETKNQAVELGRETVETTMPMGRSFHQIPVQRQAETVAGTDPIQRDGDGSMDIDEPVSEEEERENEARTKTVHSLFANAYSTHTFSRASFSEEDRENAWLEYVKAHAEHTGEDFDEDEALDAIRDMGTTAQGIHLRHLVPYSDIAGLMHVASSGTTYNKVGADYAHKIRDHVSTYLEHIGAKDHLAAWNDLKGQEGSLVQNRNNRALVKQIYREMAHNHMNLYHGDGSANMAIGNRVDATGDAVGIHSQEHVQNLIGWWHDAMTDLGLNPEYETEDVYNLKTQQMDSVPLYSHALSRPLKAYYGDTSELEMVPKHS